MNRVFAPQLNQPVRLRTWDGDTAASRVEDLRGEQITIARPVGLPAGDDVADGTELLLTWPGQHGLVVLPVRLAGTRRENAVGLWDLAIAGEGWHEQRREYVRVPAAGPLVLRVLSATEGTAPNGTAPNDTATNDTVTDDDADGVVPDGYLVDVGEAALQCSLPRSPQGALLAEGVAVSCSFRLGEAEFELPGHVTAHRFDYPAPDRVGVIVAFDHAPQQAQALRREIFAQQLRNRH